VTTLLFFYSNKSKTKKMNGGASRRHSSFWFYVLSLSTGQKFNRVKEGIKIEMKVKDDITEEIKTKAKNALR